MELTQQDIGEFLGMQRTTDNMAAMALKAMGAIRYSRGTIDVVDRAVLRTRACECYRTGRANRMPVAS